MSLLPNLDELDDEQKMAVLESVQKSIAQSKEIQKRKIGENVDLVVQALKKIEEDIRSRYDDIGNAIEKRVASIKDGRDGIDGRDGKDGKDGKQGKEGRPGRDGKDGKNGLNGVDGQDGVSVVNAHIDFDGSLIISLSSGKEINVGEVVAPALAEQIKVITNGGGTSQSVLDTLTSLQSQIDALSGATIYKGLWNASTNSPSLTSSVGTSGNFYIVSVAGSTSLDGITNWGVGDWAIFNGTVWQRVEGGAAGNFTTVTASSLTSGRVTYAGTGGLLQDSSNLTFNGTTLTSAGFSGPLNGTVGATTPSTGAFTTLSATGTIQSTGYLGVASSPVNYAAIEYAETTAVSGGSLYGIELTPSLSAGTTAIEGVRSRVRAATGTHTSVIAVRAGLDGFAAGSTITTGYGVRVTKPSGAATTLYGVASEIDAASGYWNIYASGTANNVFAGNVRIGSVVAPTVALDVTGAISASGNATVGSATAMSAGGQLVVSADAGSVPLGGNYYNIIAKRSGTAGFGSGIALVASNTGFNRVGFGDTDSIEVGFIEYDHTSNFMRFAVSGSERLRIDSSGNVGIGTSSPTNKLTVDGNANITGNTTLGDASTDTVTVNGYMGVGGAGASSIGIYQRSTALTGSTQNGIYAEPTFSSAATNAGTVLGAEPKTAAASFTLANLYGVRSRNVTLGAGSAVTTHHGIYVDDLTSATNNYGITSLVSSGANKYNIYASGTAENYFAGNVGIGAVAGSTTGQLRIAGNGSGATTFNGISLETSIQSGVTSAWRGLLVRPTTQATAFTLNNLYGVYVNPQTFGAGSTVTNQFGFHAENTLTGATNNYGFYSNIASGTGRWNFYANGTADNYFAGNVGIGTSSPSSKLEVYDATSAVARVTAGTEIFEIRNTGSEVRLAVVSADPMTFRTSNVEAMRIDSSGNVGIGTSSPTAKLDVSSDVIRLRTAKTPASASATGNAGDIAWDSSYIYVCVATNTWKRVAIATW